MVLKPNQFLQNVGIFFVVANTVLLGLAFGQVHSAAAIFYPAAGVSVAIFYVYRKRVLGGLILGIILPQVIYRISTVDESIWQSITLGILFLLVAIAEIYLFTVMLDKLKYKVETAFSFNESGKYMLAVVVATAIGALIGIIGLLLYFDDIEIVKTYFYWMIGDATGIIVFGSLIIYHNYYDKLATVYKNKTVIATIYLVLFALLAYFIFGNFGNDYLDFGSFQIFLVLFYIAAAFMFSFRIIIFNNVIFLLCVNFFYFPSYTGENLLFEAIKLSLFLIIMSSTSSSVRVLILERKANYDQMKTAKDSLEKLIISTNDLVNVENMLPESEKSFSKDYLKNMFEIACEIYPNFDRASCNVNNGKYVEFVAVKNYSKEHLNNMQFLASEFVWALKEPEIVTTTDYEEVFDENNRGKEFIDEYGNMVKSIRFTVFIGENTFAGMSFDIFEDSEYDFTRKDLSNYKSFQNLMNSYYKIGILNNEKDVLKDDIVLSLVRTLELYDLYTGGHSEQVAHLCVEYAKIVGLASDEIRELYWAGIVHDIGKIGLPMDVLNLERKLKDEEYELIKQHSINGYNVLSRSKSLEKIAKIVLHHHEWYNGKGYPEGLKSDEIPYHARILHVCDAIDSMAKDRIYRKALTEQRIIQELEKGKGKQFDPGIVDVMVQFIQSGRLYEVI